ncbi:FAD binding domain-containing protein [Didymella exigua CBS 183.55]|uniref:Delta(24)-sterol reductase n=1 Tax=Didymella exigua CBS 183.55 TaxID=1150837 RepID=A0A6A5R862_9PLEO|nr:FAD binding domain-containing protein [Didymella exigua CBS 183.55]KAF1923368.1 FAD binding domain-containing protein [Didymella exigua CBS 183.55]
MDITTGPTRASHERIVAGIQKRISQFHSTSTPFRIYHGSTNSTRHASFDPSAIIDVSGLNRILSIDTSASTALVEPNVPMDKLVARTAVQGFLPPVVMEFPGITVGGGFVGTAGESSSFKYGFFDRTVVRAEVILANGTLVNCSATENAELFEGLRGSFGTLGVLTLVEVMLVPLKSWVEVTYRRTTSSKEAVEVLQAETEKEENDYVDGVLFAKDSGVVVSGRLLSEPSSPKIPVRRFSRPWDEWFWIHARSLVSSPLRAPKTPTVELVPVEDYLFRYDRGAFWMGMYAYYHFFVPFWYVFRVLLDYFMHTRIMYHALHASGYTDRYVIQDIAFPAGNAEAFVDYVDDKFGIYPLWLCPLRKDGRVSMGHPKQFEGHVGGQKQSGHAYESLYINVGVWGPYPSFELEYVRANRELEKKTGDLGGLKWLYSRVFYTEDEWWQLYDKNKYDELRRKFGATGLPSIWEKVRDRGNKKEDYGTDVKGLLKRLIRSSALLSGFYGIYKAVRGGDYMLKKKSS